MKVINLLVLDRKDLDVGSKSNKIEELSGISFSYAPNKKIDNAHLVVFIDENDIHNVLKNRFSNKTGIMTREEFLALI